MAGLSAPHKSRRKMRKNGSGVNATARPGYPLASLFWPARGSVSQWEVIPLILIVAGLFRWAAGLWSYSGFHRPPRFGDFEAQRHWMEITTHLPVSHWYFYDLEWWGLDYPPLTAYHSWLLGKMGAIVNPSWFALDTSRGMEDATLKIYMRTTVIISEYLVFVPALVIFVRKNAKLHGISSWNNVIALMAILSQPATILIDHVHFQYNGVMLGLVLACMSSILAGRLMWSCIFFVMALGFKQMSLYYAPAIFAYLLGACIFPSIKFPRFLGIVLVTVTSFAMLLLPLILGTLYDSYRGKTIPSEISSDGHPLLPVLSQYSYLLNTNSWYFPLIQQLAQLLHRVFPLARGLFEDKVANFWCALNVILKLRNYPQSFLQRASFLATLVAILPPSLAIFFKPLKLALPLALATTAWAFFLFSFQVHEKSVLLPLMPMTVLLSGNNGLSKDYRAWIGFANLLGVWTMFPLLQRVDLRFPYYVLSLLWAYLLGLPPTSFTLYVGDHAISRFQSWTRKVHLPFYLAMGLWHAAEAFLVPPDTKPDLWVVINVGIGATGFGLCYLWCLGRLWKECGLIGSRQGQGNKGKLE
ncbi:hypothetical protein K3495_g6335 [Podosphaera aphanis]|nr:hypothetical protein K3495_g6335 [Podosphaera aphanis]